MLLALYYHHIIITFLFTNDASAPLQCLRYMAFNSKDTLAHNVTDNLHTPTHN